MCLGVVVLYDHVHPVGAFAKKAAIDVRVGRCSLVQAFHDVPVLPLLPLQIKSSIRLIKEHPQSAESLLNALRYNTKHFNDEATPKATKTMLSTT